MKARKKPVIVDVMQLKMLSSRSYRKCKEFVGVSWVDYGEMPNDLPGIKTLEGTMEIADGDYIIKGVNGEFYPCKPDIFHKTYDILKEDDLSVDLLIGGKQVGEIGLKTAKWIPAPENITPYQSLFELGS